MSTTWITLDVDDLAAYLNAPQLAALKSNSLQSGQSDPVTDIIDEVSAGIRLEIATCGTNTLSATASSIPPELKAEAAALIIEAAQTRLSIALELSADQVRAANNARKKLERIARCDLKVSTPATPETTETAQQSTGISIVKSRTQRASPTAMNGL
jgi:hypothetical protein